jgi:hypothetical protein
MNFRLLNTSQVKLIRKMAVAGVSLLLVAVSLPGLTRWRAWATEFDQRLARADNSAPSLQGEAAIAHLKERKLYDSLRAALNAARGRRGGYSVVAPSLAGEQKLTASDGVVGDEFGSSVAVSGSTVVVGANYDDIDSSPNQGSAYIFELQGESWVETQKLVASDGAAGAVFGLSVAISGATIVVGAQFDDIGGNGDQGSVYVFELQDGSWVETQKLTASDGAAFDFFGHAVAVSGATIIVGAQSDDIGGNGDQGSAYVFKRQGGGWAETQKLVASDGAAGDLFGRSVAISGSTIVVGAQGHNIGSNQFQGAAYVFNRQGGSWIEAQRLTASDGAAVDQFGSSVAVNGSTIAVGAQGDGIGGNQLQGSAYIFERRGGSWVEAQKLTASAGAAFDQFGISIAVSGSSIVVGAFGDDIGGNGDQGSAYVFKRRGGSWVETRKLVASDGAAGDEFSLSVAISGSAIVVGALHGDVGANPNQGSAYVFAP